MADLKSSDESTANVPPANPLEPEVSLQPASVLDLNAHAPQPPLPADSAVTKAEKAERNGDLEDGDSERPRKRARVDDHPNGGLLPRDDRRVKGVAAVKAEYLIDNSARRDRAPQESTDDAAEATGKHEGRGKKKQKGQQGQNTKRDFGSSRDAIKLCGSRMRANELDPVNCPFGEKCKFEHDIRKYLSVGKREDLSTFNGICPLYASSGVCSNGWKCRFAGSHSALRETTDGTKENVLLGVPDVAVHDDDESSGDQSIMNIIPKEDKINLNRKKFPIPRSEPYIDWLEKMGKLSEKGQQQGTERPPMEDDAIKKEENGTEVTSQSKQDSRAAYLEPPFLPSEKRRIYYGPETPVLAPLTTQGNMPFRRLCIDLGAQITWSEMAMGQPLIQGDRSEWALLKAHSPSETTPPRYQPKNPVFDYDNSRDFKFGAQISSNKPWMALKATEIITSICPKLRAVDLNCGCPIDLVYRQGAGSALLDTPGKLEKMLRGMNAVSGEVPITVKIRMGTRDNKPSAEKLVSRLAFGGEDAHQYGLGPCGVAAVTLHGRSRQQRYTRSADWDYITKCAKIVRDYNAERDALADTVKEPDARLQANANNPGQMYFIGNGDCYSHEDYNTHLEHANVDSIMIARGALIKPWIFEEIQTGQHLDKTASERLAYIEKFVRNGLEVWGSDEQGIGLTRRFLLEWLSFACRYVPVGMLEHLPPNIQDRPPSYKGRNELETLLSSDNYKDWIKISEMFLGKAHDDFKFVPKHKSNSYEVEAEG